VAHAYTIFSLFLLHVGFILNFCGISQALVAGAEIGPLKYCIYLIKTGFFL
jgi:hypothetical protein